MLRGLAAFSRRASGVANALSTLGAILAALIFLGMSALIVTEVILRNAFGRSTLVASEFSGYALATMTYLSLAFTFREGSHIRITFLLDRLPGALRRAMEVLLTSFAAVVTFTAVLAVWEMVRTSYERGTIAYTVARTPLYVPQAIVLAGLLLLLLQLVSYALSVAFRGELLESPSEEDELARIVEEVG